MGARPPGCRDCCKAYGAAAACGVLQDAAKDGTLNLASAAGSLIRPVKFPSASASTLSASRGGRPGPARPAARDAWRLSLPSEVRARRGFEAILAGGREQDDALDLPSRREQQRARGGPVQPVGVVARTRRAVLPGQPGQQRQGGATGPIRNRSAPGVAGQPNAPRRPRPAAAVAGRADRAPTAAIAARLGERNSVLTIGPGRSTRYPRLPLVEQRAVLPTPWPAPGSLWVPLRLSQGPPPAFWSMRRCLGGPQLWSIGLKVAKRCPDRDNAGERFARSGGAT